MNSIINLKPLKGFLKCKLGKCTTLYCSVKHESGMAGNKRDECIYCGKQYVWVYLGDKDDEYSLCEVKE